MAEFWPTGIDLSDTSSPLEILKMAQRDWAQTSGGSLNLVIQKADSSDGHKILIVHAKHVQSNRTVALFSIFHRPGLPYPATIQPRGDDLPNYLKKKYFRPSWSSAIKGFPTEGETVTNEWVSDTPAEFREKLKRAFNFGTVKSEVLNLVSEETSPSEAGNVPDSFSEPSGTGDDEIASPPAPE